MTQPFEDIRERLEEIFNNENALYRIGTAYDADVSRLLSAVDALVEWGKALDKTTNNDADMRDYDKLSEAYDALSPELKEALK